MRRVMDEYVADYNARRPHLSLGQQTPVPSLLVETSGRIQRRKVLGCIINEYCRVLGQVTVVTGR